MRLPAICLGIVLIVLVAQDAFETIVLPRRVTRRIRLAKLFYRVTQMGWNSMSRLIRSSTRRDAFRGYMAVLATWLIRPGLCGKRGLSCCFTLIISREQHG